MARNCRAQCTLDINLGENGIIAVRLADNVVVAVDRVVVMVTIVLMLWLLLLLVVMLLVIRMMIHRCNFCYNCSRCDLSTVVARG